MGKRQAGPCAVHCSTDLHHANQCIAAALGEDSPVYVSAYRCKHSDSARSGIVFRRWATATSGQHDGTLFACYKR